MGNSVSFHNNSTCINQTSAIGYPIDINTPVWGFPNFPHHLNYEERVIFWFPDI